MNKKQIIALGIIGSIIFAYIFTAVIGIVTLNIQDKEFEKIKNKFNSIGIEFSYDKNLSSCDSYDINNIKCDIKNVKLTNDLNQTISFDFYSKDIKEIKNLFNKYNSDELNNQFFINLKNVNINNIVLIKSIDINNSLIVDNNNINLLNFNLFFDKIKVNIENKYHNISSFNHLLNQNGIVIYANNSPIKFFIRHSKNKIKHVNEIYYFYQSIFNKSNHLFYEIELNKSFIELEKYLSVNDNLNKLGNQNLIEFFKVLNNKNSEFYKTLNQYKNSIPIFVNKFLHKNISSDSINILFDYINGKINKIKIIIKNDIIFIKN